MIKVGFVASLSKEWMGGVNYFKNLLYAIHMEKDDALHPIVFLGYKADPKIKQMLSCYAEIVEHPMFDKKSIQWYASKIINKVFKVNWMLEHLLKKHGVQVLSHSDSFNLKTIKTINWIPDFQHIHLPELFSEQELAGRDKTYTKIIEQSDIVVVSSYDALDDLYTFYSKKANNARVLQFVSQVDSVYSILTGQDKVNLLNKYRLPETFYYIPNQFWQHKNHKVVFEAVKKLKDRGIDINIVCTGYLDDYRNSQHINELKQFILSNQLNDRIFLLGLVEYSDVFSLIKFSKAVINPSLFEGWSSTVEECKSVYKPMILSDLDVHKEQYPNALFFNRYNSDELADLLGHYSNVDFDKSKIDIESLEDRTTKFANTYNQIVIDCLHSNKL